MLSCHQNQDNISTKFLLRKPNGQMIDSQTIDGLCSVKAILNAYKLLINCQDKSMILEENPFSITPFGKSIQIIALSPYRSQLVILFADQTAVLLTDSLVEIESLRLQKTPNEIHWLPDSSGFLYRAIDQLHYHNLTSQADLFLVSSDFFFDYRNLNAVWVHIK